MVFFAIVVVVVVGAVFLVAGCAATRNVEMYNGCAWDDDTE